MLKMIRLGVLASTKGTDMPAIIDAIEAKKLNAEIAVVISDKKNAYALDTAKKYNIKAIFLDPKGKEKEEYDKEIHKILQEEKVDLVLLIGYMNLISKWFVKKYENRVMNIHPSLLPAYSGRRDLNVHEEVIKRGCKITGCSLIFIDEGSDTGPIILQKTVDVEDDDTAETLKERVQKSEQEILIKGIELFAENKLKVKGRKVKITNNRI
ncbi:phosphoribosylglycinamide formyltransferase [Candidatus Woesearchaeota archaeon]|nr:phosphoribosylglycinamide formyltransferase [Candidatus Woesearchaeota archaeon]